MKRFVVIFCALATGVMYPVAALANPAGAGSASGTVTAIEGSIFTIQTGGRLMGVTNALTAAADAITKDDYPYVWGGGHGEAGVASIGIKGPGYNGRRVGLDCSGSVAAVLASAGLWPPGASVPADAGVISELLANRLIARGPGTAPDEVTLYDDPGVHIFMNIDGRFFGTSDGGGGGNRRGGAGWLYDGAYDATDPAFKKFHFLPSVLGDHTTYGHLFTFEAGNAIDGLLDEFQVDDKIRVGYSETRAGTMVAQAVSWVGALTRSGTITSISATGSSITVTTPAGATLVLHEIPGMALLDGLQVGDKVTAVYTKLAGVLTARGLTVSATPAPTATTPPTTTPAGYGPPNLNGYGPPS